GYARWWYGFVALPVFYFVGFRVLWRWAVWCRFLWRVSRAPLHLQATHPDRAGGLELVDAPTLAIAQARVGTSAIAAATWGHRIVFEHAHAKAFTQGIALLVVVVLLLAFAPSLFFFRRLLSLYREGLLEYGSLALDYSRRFQQRWIPGPREGLL